jgi:hypothetical protein
MNANVSENAWKRLIRPDVCVKLSATLDMRHGVILDDFDPYR